MRTLAVRLGLWMIETFGQPCAHAWHSGAMDVTHTCARISGHAGACACSCDATKIRPFKIPTPHVMP